MKAIDKKDMLKERITALENQQIEELIVLKLEFHSLTEMLNPLYLLKSTFKNLTADPEIKSGLLDGAVNMTSHYLTKIPFLGRFQQPIKNIIGNVLQTVIKKISPTRPRIS